MDQEASHQWAVAKYAKTCEFHLQDDDLHKNFNAGLKTLVPCSCLLYFIVARWGIWFHSTVCIPIEMGLQWYSVMAFLYAEMVLGLLLCFSCISNTSWRILFNSSLITRATRRGKVFFVVFVLFVLLLFADCIWKMLRYAHVDTRHSDLRNDPHAEVRAHMKLFRVQRNSLICGFSLFMLIILRRLVALVSSQASLEASLLAAAPAVEQATMLMDENERLLRRSSDRANRDVGEDDESELIARLMAELEESNQKSAQNEQGKLRAERNLEALNAQSEGLHKEYDRLVEKHSRVREKLSTLTGCLEENEA